MWIATRSFRYRDKRYEPGDTVPAETWPNRRALVAIRRIKWVADDEATAEPTPVNLRAMKRADLDAYAATQGILDAAAYPNKDALIAAIEGEPPPEPVDETADTVGADEPLTAFGLAAPPSSPGDVEPDAADGPVDVLPTRPK